MARRYEWRFPLPRTHTGMLQGNGTFGAMVWGDGRVLRITIGRADFWDHRGGIRFKTAQSYKAIRRCLERNDAEGLNRRFRVKSPPPGEPSRPSVLPIGRIDIDFGPGAKLTTGTLNIDDGCVTVRVRKAGRERAARIALDMREPILLVRFAPGAAPRAIRRVPAWRYVGEHLASVSFQPPEMFEAPRLSGWTQMRPADPTLCVGYRLTGRELAVTAVCGDSAGGARRAAARAVSSGLRRGYARTAGRNRRWWSAYWRRAARVRLPNEKLQFLHDYGMYKFAGLTNPDGVAATLQGPWIEEYQMPPWSSDYHFNINVQMCYWPAYHGNLPDHLGPLFEMIRSWMPLLRHNAKVFLGIRDGLMLPHAVDDRCTCMGGFWTGSIDHGCTAWIARMMYRRFRYTMDRRFLRDTAYPFMAGVMRVYEKMLERKGEAFVLPVSVSPEYRGARMDAWGADASFQLACIHRLVEDLLEAAAVLGKRPRPIWKQIAQRLPKASLSRDTAGSEVIALWQGTPLEESHRHHSHLAGVAPFDIFDFDDPRWWSILADSARQWIRTGPGLWSGWCVPWASMIHSRFGNADAAELWLEIWQKLFTNEGHGTLHDVHFAGFSLMGQGATCSPTTRKEIMQIEAGMSCVAAIHEMLLHVRRGVNYLFRGAPGRWKSVAFENMRTDGAFVVSAGRKAGRVGPVRVTSLAGGVFRLANPWPGRAILRRGRRKSQLLEARVLEVKLAKGETALIARAARCPPGRNLLVPSGFWLQKTDGATIMR